MCVPTCAITPSPLCNIMCGTHWITTHSLQPSVVRSTCVGYVCTYLSISLVVRRSGALHGYIPLVYRV
jgi:hypothetical protein